MSKGARRELLGRIAACGAALALLGCDGDGEDRAPPVGADIAGRWSGVYYVEGHTRIPITAKIAQDGDAVRIVTSKKNPPGQRFTGRIDEEGLLTLTDASDGQTWTSLAPATHDHVIIGDYIRRPTAEDRLEGHDVPMRVIDLER